MQRKVKMSTEGTNKDKKPKTRIHLQGTLNPLITAMLTDAIYTARLLHLQKGTDATPEEITAEVGDLWSFLLAKLQKTSPAMVLEVEFSERPEYQE